MFTAQIVNSFFSKQISKLKFFAKYEKRRKIFSQKKPGKG